MKRLKILRVQSRICIGGPALNTILLSAYLDPERYESLLIGGHLDAGEKSLLPMAESKGVAVEILDEMGRSIHWWDDLRALWRMIRMIRRERPDIVHTHTAKAGAIGRLAAWLCRVPIRVHTFHGHVFHGYFTPTQTRVFIWIERVLAWMSSRIVAISPRQYQDLVSRYKIVSERKCRIVRLGFELDKMIQGEPGRLRSELELAEDVRLAGIIARLAPIKNHALLIHGIAAWRAMQAPEALEQTRFLIVGDGELREALETQVRDLGLDDLVIFLGWRQDMPHIYADLDLNILVSKNEGTPVTLIEGLACGVPVLATDVGGVRDFVDEGLGTILPPDITPPALAEALSKMLDRADVRLDVQETQSVRDTFNARRLATDMDALYQECLDERRR